MQSWPGSKGEKSAKTLEGGKDVEDVVAAKKSKMAKMLPTWVVPDAPARSLNEIFSSPDEN